MGFEKKKMEKKNDKLALSNFYNTGCAYVFCTSEAFLILGIIKEKNIYWKKKMSVLSKALALNVLVLSLASWWLSVITFLISFFLFVS